MSVAYALNAPLSKRTLTIGLDNTIRPKAEGIVKNSALLMENDIVSLNFSISFCTKRVDKVGSAAVAKDMLKIAKGS
jgi:hypothetical protein